MRKVAIGMATIASLWLMLLGAAWSQNVNGTPEVAAAAGGELGGRIE